MQVKDSYDLIVVGDQLGGLFLAAGAAQMGMKVLVLEGTSVPSVLYELPSGRFLVDLLAEPLIGIEKGSKTDKFFAHLGLYENIDTLFPEHNEALQVVTPRQRFPFRYRASELVREIAREFPGYDSAGLAKLLSGDTVSKDSFATLVEKAGLSVDWESFGGLQTKLYGAMGPKDLPYPAYHEVCALARRGVRYVKGGRSALKQHLLSRIGLFGGSVKKLTWVDEIVFERGRLAGVLLSSYEGFVRSPVVVGAMGARTFYELVPEEYRPRALGKLIQDVRPSHWRFNFTLLVPESVIPEGMASHVSFFDPARPLEEENFLQVQVFPKEAYGGTPAGHRVLLVRVLMPFEERNMSKRAIQRVLKRSMDKLETLMPFLYESTIQLFPDPLKPEHEPIFERYYQFKSLDHIPPSFLVYDSLLTSSFDNRHYMDWNAFGLPGLALCSRDVRPLLGITGEIFTAMDLLGTLEKRRRSKK